MKKLLALFTLVLVTNTSFVLAQNERLQNIDERQDIADVVKELDYLIDVTRNMQNKYKYNKSRITFNYQALLEQLISTRNRTAEYLNTQGQQIHATAPNLIDSELLRLK